MALTVVVKMQYIVCSAQKVIFMYKETHLFCAQCRIPIFVFI